VEGGTVEFGKGGGQFGIEVEFLLCGGFPGGWIGVGIGG